ncbi:TcaA NTF2-like domain-containing protein [Corticicoccus populi]|uniref:Zinc-ribbon domain-containing protein n=1 Tax=Corticicoccus populi TaxID=1812821 RepID=A0ABW5WZ46_9STAP
MKFCKNCGAKLRDDSKVCTQCGTNQSESTQNENNTAHSEYTRKTPPSEPQKPMDPKKKKILFGSIGGVLVLAAALFITYKILESVYSPDGMVDDFNNAVANEDPAALKDAVSTDISDEEAAAYIAFVDNEIGFSQFGSWMNEVKENLSNDGSSPNITSNGYDLAAVEQTGKHLGLFDDYAVTIPKYNVMTNNNNIVDTFSYELNGDTVEWQTSEEKFNELIPGKYTFSGTGIKDGESFDARVSIDFADYDSSGNVGADLDVDLYYVSFSASLPSSYLYDISEDDISFNMNGEEVEETELPGFDSTFVGPLKNGEEYEFTGQLNFEGETFDMSPVTLNISPEDLSGQYNPELPHHEIEVQFDDEAITNHYDTVQEREAVEEQREDFEENLEDETESFIRSYFTALQSMYFMEDINEVEDYIQGDSDIESLLQSNIDNSNFENMTISNIRFSNYSRDGDTIEIETSTRRNHDNLDSPATFRTKYTIQYNSDDLSLIITNFEDL